MSLPTYTLAQDGDVAERRYWNQFLAKRFPSYERFWTSDVVAVTRRGIDRSDIRFRSDDELAAIGRTDDDVAVAQLHYTVMVHLGRSHDLRREPLDRWTFSEVFVRLTGASDCADELLERVTNPGVYHPWSEDEGRKARARWRQLHGRPLQALHDYRNRLVHGRVVPELIATVAGSDEQVYIFPRIDRVNDYLDWRRAFGDIDGALSRDDFASAQTIAEDAWNMVVNHCESAWRTHLIPPDDAPSSAVSGDDLPPPTGGSVSARLP